MFLAQIVTKGKFENLPFFINVTDKCEDFSIPTLVIGKKRAVEIFGKDKIHVLDKHIDGCVYWTFAKNERRVDFENDVEKFKELVFCKLKNGVSYYFLNIFTEKMSFIKKFIKFIYGKDLKVVYVTDKHVYIYGGKSVIGLSLADFDYCGIDSDKVLSKIASNHSNVIIKEEDIKGGEFFMPGISNIFIPYIHYLSVKENF